MMTNMLGDRGDEVTMEVTDRFKTNLIHLVATYKGQQENDTIKMGPDGKTSNGADDEVACHLEKIVLKEAM